jgi:hypothetical protein
MVSNRTEHGCEWLVFIIGDFGLVFGHFRLFNKKGGFMGGGVFGFIRTSPKKT